MISVTFNGEKETGIASIEDFGISLDRFDSCGQFELWLSAPSSTAMCMLRNGEYAFLMYLRFSGDSGFVTRSETPQDKFVSYTLSTGQIDEYPASWCLSVEQCYKALAYFFVNEGLMPDWVDWREV
jgi:hypothetical protein